MKITTRWTLAVTLPLLLVAACSTTTFESTWKSTDAAPVRLGGKKIAAMFLSRNPSTRRQAEDAMAREITARGAVGVASYTLLSDAEVKDQEGSKKKLDDAGFSGTVAMQIVGKETRYTREPMVWAGPHYRHFWGGYWRWGWGSVWDPGYLSVDKIVKVETLVYSLDRDELLWAGVSNTVDPARIDGFIGELAASVSKEMTKEGVLAAASGS